MKLSYERRNDGKLYLKVPEKIPKVTLNEHLQRIEEWTQRAAPVPPPNYSMPYPIDRLDNADLEAQSELIVEGVMLLDDRDQQIASKPPIVVGDNHKDSDYTSDEEVNQQMNSTVGNHDNEYLNGGLGRRFRESKMTAKSYVKDFENKVNRRRAIESAIFSAYPYLKAKLGFKTKNHQQHYNISTANNAASSIEETVTAEETNNLPHKADERDSWRERTSRNVRFTMNYRRQGPIGEKSGLTMAAKHSDQSDLGDDSWTVNKHENDRDWWKWKLKQRVLENDELLQKLVAQRHKIESTFLHPGSSRAKSRRESKRNVPTFPSFVPSLHPLVGNTSRHITVEFQSPQKPKTFAAVDSFTRKSSNTRAPIPSFYSPSKQLLDVITTTGITPAEASIPLPGENPNSGINPKKLKTLKKDPYLAKLLAGNEMFKPEVMLDVTQASSQRSDMPSYHHHRHHLNTSGGEHGRNARRKISLESFTDSTDDDMVASRYFNPDVQVIYERLSDVDINAQKSKVPVGGLGAAGLSREPSDGYINLPILLATGRFNRYNKLPSMKVFENLQQKLKNETAKVTVAGDKSLVKTYKVDNNSNKIKKDNFMASKMGTLPPQGQGQPNKTFVGSTNNNKSPFVNKVDDLSTKDWAKRLMQRMKQRQSGASAGGGAGVSNSFRTEDDETLFTESDGVVERMSTTEFRDPNFYNQPHNIDGLGNGKKYKVPIDQETNLLYHEILMSKWKKDKHEDRNKDVGAGVVMPTTTPVPMPMAWSTTVNRKQSSRPKSISPKQHPHHHHHHHHRSRNADGKKPGNENEKEVDKNKKADNAEPNNPISRTRPKGLDIWLENIRERARKERLISPLPGADAPLSNLITAKGKAPSFITAFENASFKINNNVD